MRNVSSGENPASVQYRCNYWWEKWRLYDVFLIVFTLLYIGMIYKEILCLPLQQQAHIHYNTRKDITKKWSEQILSKNQRNIEMDTTETILLS